MEYQQFIPEPWFSLIKTGVKTTYATLLQKYVKNIVKGDVIVFHNDELGFTRKVSVKITSLHTYSTFLECFEKESLEKLLPGIDTLEEGIFVYNNVYSTSDQKKHKVVAIRFRLKQ